MAILRAWLLLACAITAFAASVLQSSTSQAAPATAVKVELTPEQKFQGAWIRRCQSNGVTTNDELNMSMIFYNLVTKYLAGQLQLPRFEVEIAKMTASYGGTQLGPILKCAMQRFYLIYRPHISKYCLVLAHLEVMRDALKTAAAESVISYYHQKLFDALKPETPDVEPFTSGDGVDISVTFVHPCNSRKNLHFSKTTETRARSEVSKASTVAGQCPSATSFSPQCAAIYRTRPCLTKMRYDDEDTFRCRPTLPIESSSSLSQAYMDHQGSLKSSPLYCSGTAIMKRKLCPVESESMSGCKECMCAVSLSCTAIEGAAEGGGKEEISPHSRCSGPNELWYMVHRRKTAIAGDITVKVAGGPRRTSLWVCVPPVYLSLKAKPQYMVAPCEISGDCPSYPVPIKISKAKKKVNVGALGTDEE